MPKSSFYSGTGLTNNDQNAIDGAKNAAEAAKEAAETAQGLAEDARDIAQASGNSAQASANSAQASVSSISGSVGTATTAAQDAVDARDLAEQYRDQAQSARSDAISSEAGAGNAQAASESARDLTQGYRDDTLSYKNASQTNLESFQSIYIGSSSTNPSTDGNGNALTAGDMYLNTGNNYLNIHDGTNWFPVNAPVTTSTNGYMIAADKTKLDGLTPGGEPTNATTVESAGALMDSELTDETSVKAINQGLATTDNVTFNSSTITTYNDFTPVSGANPSAQEGRIFYDDDLKTLAYYSDVSGVTHEIGIEEHQRVYNDTGSTIPKGAPLFFQSNYVSGTIDVPKVGLADATSQAAYNAQGLAAADIADGAYGYCIIAGQLHGVDTSSLFSGTNFFVGLTPGTWQNQSPLYPNYPMCLGWVVKSHATDGILLVNQQNHSVNSFRVQTSAHIGNNLQVDGNLTVLGTTTSVSTADVTAGAPFYRANEGDAIGEAGTTFTGTGLDDAFFAGHFTGTAPTTYYVKIDSVGTPDTFAVSVDNFATTVVTNVAITGSEQLIHSADNISVTFGSTTGHTLNDVWTGTASPINVDSGFFTNFNTGGSGTGYTHTGFFYDASEAKWTILSEYDPVPAGAIDLADASATLGTIKAGTFEGDLNGNIPNAVTIDGNITANSTSSFNDDVSMLSTSTKNNEITIRAATGQNYFSANHGGINLGQGHITFSSALIQPGQNLGDPSTLAGHNHLDLFDTKLSQRQVSSQEFRARATAGYELDFAGWAYTTKIQANENVSQQSIIKTPADHSGTIQTQGRSIAMSLILG
ncbi:MAG: hypothetical protein CMA71_05645 [Euryarchaeota archaeon]|jgi:hypothetical protein|nr:hypothetical protein [Euryarchaeota archaeon]|tara:strand:- start:3745 stop:6189 length:2445 start_codon:yes stop_codon:yes gene_type:complete